MNCSYKKRGTKSRKKQQYVSCLLPVGMIQLTMEVFS